MIQCHFFSLYFTFDVYRIKLFLHVLLSVQGGIAAVEMQVGCHVAQEGRIGLTGNRQQVASSIVLLAECRGVPVRDASP